MKTHIDTHYLNYELQTDVREVSKVKKQTEIRYNTTKEFTMDWKAECGQLDLARESKKKNKKKKLKQTPCQLSPVSFKIREGSPTENRKLWRKGFVKQVSFKSGIKGRGSDRWWE